MRIAMRWLTRAILGIGVLGVSVALAGAAYEAIAATRDALLKKVSAACRSLFEQCPRVHGRIELRQ